MKGNVDTVSSSGQGSQLRSRVNHRNRPTGAGADGGAGPYGNVAARIRDEAFLTGAGSSTPVTPAAELRLPSGGSERVPAFVMLHGSSGISPGHDRWTRELNGLGIATFLIDSSTGRGLSSTVEDQSRLGQMAMVYDAYRALELLAKHPRIDPTRFGNSRGGVGALYASVSRFQRLHAPTEVAFAVYVSLYPPCTREYIDDAKVADRPIRIVHGTADVIAPIERCRAYVRRMQAAGADVQLIEYEGAHHGFDGHQLPVVSGPQPARRPSVARCSKSLPGAFSIARRDSRSRPPTRVRRVRGSPATTRATRERTPVRRADAATGVPARSLRAPRDSNREIKMVRILTLSLTVSVGVVAMVAAALGAFGRTVSAQQPTASPVVSRPDSAELLTMDSGTMRILAEGKTTNGAVTVLDSVLRSGYWTNPHTHGFAESFYVLEGTMTVEIAGVRHQLTPGSYAWVPPNVSHALGNDGQVLVRNILTTSPAGIETMFRRRAEEFKRANAPKP